MRRCLSAPGSSQSPRDNCLVPSVSGESITEPILAQEHLPDSFLCTAPHASGKDMPGGIPSGLQSLSLQHLQEAGRMRAMGGHAPNSLRCGNSSFGHLRLCFESTCGPHCLLPPPGAWEQEPFYTSPTTTEAILCPIPRDARHVGTNEGLQEPSFFLQCNVRQPASLPTPAVKGQDTWE